MFNLEVLELVSESEEVAVVVEEFEFVFEAAPLKSEPPKARIQSISNYGVVKVAFDQMMMIPSNANITNKMI